MHVHSVLSACCSRDNTVTNIVNMSKLLGTKFLGVADHNSCLNFPAVNVTRSKNAEKENAYVKKHGEKI